MLRIIRNDHCSVSSRLQDLILNSEAQCLFVCVRLCVFHGPLCSRIRSLELLAREQFGQSNIDYAHVHYYKWPLPLPLPTTTIYFKPLETYALASFVGTLLAKQPKPTDQTKLTKQAINFLAFKLTCVRATLFPFVYALSLQKLTNFDRADRYFVQFV